MRLRIPLSPGRMLETSREPAMRTAPSDLDIKPEPQIHIEAIPDSASDDSASDTAPQHQQELQPSNFDLHAGHLIASPYPDRANQLDLQTPDPQSRFFAFALSTLTPATPLYATATYTAAFNWSTVFSALRTLCYQQDIHWQRQECYVVIFRSKLRKGADRIRLGELDRKAHEEACASGGLLKYWFGCADGDGRNLATCVPLL